MIRPVVPGDAGQICDLYNPYVAKSTITFEEYPVESADMQRRISEIAKTLPWLVDDREGRVVGYAYANGWKTRSAYRRTVEATVYVREGHHGRGIGKNLYASLIEGLRDLGIHAILAGIALPNEKSIGLHESFGFSKVAQLREVGLKFGQWIDVGYWELILDEASEAASDRKPRIGR